MTNEGDSFYEVAKMVEACSHFSLISEECSWLDGFARIRAEPQMHSVAFESTVLQFALAKEKVTVNKAQVEEYRGYINEQCLCPNELKQTCRISEVGKCASSKKMKVYLIAGKEVPRSMMKNKFIVMKTKHAHVYKVLNGF
jgi:hypothetical protein